MSDIKVEVWSTADTSKDWGRLREAHYIPTGEHHDYCFVLVGVCDGVAVEYFGQDGGEPEDQLLVRDWSWVVGLARELVAARASNSAMEAERDEAEEVARKADQYALKYMAERDAARALLDRILDTFECDVVHDPDDELFAERVAEIFKIDVGRMFEEGDDYPWVKPWAPRQSNGACRA